jgi:hypothetical protein
MASTSVRRPAGTSCRIEEVLSAVAPATDSTAAAALSGMSIPSARATRADLLTGRRRHALGVVVEERPAVDPGECRRRVDAGVDR